LNKDDEKQNAARGGRNNFSYNAHIILQGHRLTEQGRALGQTPTLHFLYAIFNCMHTIVSFSYISVELLNQVSIVPHCW